MKRKRKVLSLTESKKYYKESDQVPQNITLPTLKKIIEDNQAKFSKFKPFKQFLPKKASELIEKTSTEEKYWFIKEVRMQNPVPNMGSRRYTGTSLVKEDVFTTKKVPNFFMGIVAYCAVSFKNAALYVHNGAFGFSPTFCLVFLNENTKKNTVRFVFKFKESCVTKKAYDLTIKTLYSKENLAKLKQFGFDNIKSLDHYEY